MGEPIKNHQVLWKHDGSDIVGQILCPEPPGALCHQCDEGCAHTAEDDPHLECLVADDIMTNGTTYVYCGDSTQVKNDRIEIDWDGSDWVWWYEGDTHAQLDPKGLRDVEDVQLPEITPGSVSVFLDCDDNCPPNQHHEGCWVTVFDTEGSQVP